MSYEPIEEYPLKRLVALARRGAAEHKEERQRLEREGKALVLCGPDCPQKHPKLEHAHTWWDMYRMAPMAAYEAELRRRARERDAGGPEVNTVAVLESAGVGEVHLEGLKRIAAMRAKGQQHPQGWMALRAARLWLSQERPVLPPDEYGRPSRLGALPLPWLLLLGRRGTGKTQAAVYAMERWARGLKQTGASGGRPVPPCLLVHGTELATLAMPSWDSKYGAEARLEDMLRTRFLVLDDPVTALKERGGGAAATLLLRILDTRYSHRRYTVLTDNLTLDDLERHLDFNGQRPRGQEGEGRIWRRCVESGFVLNGQELKAGGVVVPLRQAQGGQR